MKMTQVRRLGFLETWLTLMHDKAYGTAQPTMLMSVKGEVSLALFHEPILALGFRLQQ